MTSSKAVIGYPQLQAAQLASTDKVAFLSHLTGLDATSLHIIRVRHSEERMKRVLALERMNKERKSGYITLLEAMEELDVTVLHDGFNVLYDQDQDTYIGIVNYR